MTRCNICRKPTVRNRKTCSDECMAKSVSKSRTKSLKSNDHPFKKAI